MWYGHYLLIHSVSTVSHLEPAFINIMFWSQKAKLEDAAKCGKLTTEQGHLSENLLKTDGILEKLIPRLITVTRKVAGNEKRGEVEVGEETVQKYQERKEEGAARQKVKEGGSTGDMSFWRERWGTGEREESGEAGGSAAHQLVWDVSPTWRETDGSNLNHTAEFGSSDLCLFFAPVPLCFQLTFPHFCSLSPVVRFFLSLSRVLKQHTSRDQSLLPVCSHEGCGLQGHQSSAGDRMRRWGAPIKISSVMLLCFLIIFGLWTVAAQNLKDPCTVELLCRHFLHRCTKVLFTGKYFPGLTYIVIIVVCAPPNWTISTALNEAVFPNQPYLFRVISNTLRCCDISPLPLYTFFFFCLLQICFLSPIFFLSAKAPSGNVFFFFFFLFFPWCKTLWIPAGCCNIGRYEYVDCLYTLKMNKLYHHLLCETKPKASELNGGDYTFSGALIKYATHMQTCRTVLHTDCWASPSLIPLPPVTLMIQSYCSSRRSRSIRSHTISSKKLC